MKLAYDGNASRLNVTITHEVSDPNRHYVSIVKVNRNEVTVLTEEYTSQPAPGTFSYAYDVPAYEGDMLEVTAECNLGGSITAQLSVQRVQGPSTEEGGKPGLWPLHAVLMVTALAVSLIGTYGIYVKRHSWWFKLHKASGTFGALLGAAGLVLGAYAVSKAGQGHMRVPHAYLGALTIVFVLVGPILGVLFLKTKSAKRKIRTIHVWWGRSTVLLMLIAVLLGLRLVGLI